MPKEDIFSKINLKDYNSILERVLEQKAFTSDVKSLLLSMFYKIENGYEDYKTIKVDVRVQKYFLKKIVTIVKDDCNSIKLIKPLSEESQILEEKNVNYIVNKEEGKIICYPNERMLLEALVTLNQKEIRLDEKYSLYEKGILDVLYKGSRMSIVEVIRDFNGWSWDITTSQMEDKNINLIYQNLNILLGNSFLQKWMADEVQLEEYEIPNNEILRSKYNEDFGMTTDEVKENNEVDYIDKMYRKLSKLYGEQNAVKFMEEFKKTMIVVGYNRNEEQRKIILDEKEKITEKLEKMKDNRTYIEDLTTKKKLIAKQIKNIDTILSDDLLLKEEYERRNSKLPNNQKIFSVSHFKIMLNKQRKIKLEKIDEYNKQMQPKEFVTTKNELEEKYQFFNELEIEEGKRANEVLQINNFQIAFLNCFVKKISKAEEKSDIKDLIYEYRYYKFLPYRQGKVSDLQEINDQYEEKIKEIEENLIKKGCFEKILVIFTKNKDLNQRILINIFESKIINLENTNYILRYHKGILNLEIYDSEVEEEEKQIEIREKVEMEVKLNKKIKIFE